MARALPIRLSSAIPLTLGALALTVFAIPSLLDLRDPDRQARSARATQEAEAARVSTANCQRWNALPSTTRVHEITQWMRGNPGFGDRIECAVREAEYFVASVNELCSIPYQDGPLLFEFTRRLRERCP